MEQKIKQIVLALYGVGILKIISMIYFLSLRLQAMRMYAQYPDMPYTGPGFFGFDLAFDVLLLVALFHTVKGIKLQKTYAWVAAISICLFTMTGFALPAAVYGLVLLFNEQVREPFIKELTEKIKV